ncbi:MAG: hypothetical protein A2Y64_08980 [Candidatus Coatesbacteria bacterium RBG_13_66_14]|uniref:Secretion system C-terminal sorting domain-containing protein n=1 Tax=Candidatus Coatesbacteria bacterium RBG_13_66_14 TaxID=1817816 RepID=A0A1F5EXC2_9BACT|nr:MAG: hypothetical protein A2Y64_08980 [Candidatus Coatesbacteria bacterium RBG_13_66_14]
MRKILSCLLLGLAISASADSAAQTEWAGGGGVPGPVTDWSYYFASSENIDYYTTWGEFSLVYESVEHLVASDFEYAIDVYAADIDDDEDVDILGAAWGADDIAWWENRNGLGTSWTRHTVDGDFDGAYSVHAADIDGDDDLDILGAGLDCGDIVWWENDGTGGGWLEHEVDGAFDGASCAYAADFDGDDDLDVLGAASEADEVTWWENTDGSGMSWTEHAVQSGYDCPYSVHAADVDGDDDTDILGAALYGYDITWWENTDGSGTSWTAHHVDQVIQASSVYAADVDGDEDLDIIGTSSWDDEIAWWENLDGSGSTWTKHSISHGIGGACSAYAADIDGDDDIDGLCAASSSYDIIWWENDDGSGTSWTIHLVDGDVISAASVYAADINGDEALDVAGAVWGNDPISWWELIGIASTGWLKSSILDTETQPVWGIIRWTADVPAETSLTVEVRAGSAPGQMGTWTEVDSSGDDLSDYIADGKRYFQYQITLDSYDNEANPTFEYIIIYWSGVGVELAELSADSTDNGILVNWTVTGDIPSWIQVLREVDGEIAPLHADALPGSATLYLDRGVEPGVDYRYWLDVTEADGTVCRLGPTEAVRIEPEGLALSLSEPYPSPASDTVTIAFTLPDDGPMELAVYDLAGRRVATLVNGEVTAGRHEVVWDCSLSQSGVYLYRLKTAEDALVKRLIISR